MIPKRIIHIYCAPAGASAELPLACRAAVVNARLLHPGFEHIVFDRPRMEALVRAAFPEYEKAFFSFPLPIQQFDLFRYLAIYKLGGFYFDLDLFLAQSVESLLDHECVFPFEELTLSGLLRDRYKMDWEAANYGFGAGPGNPFLKAIIENCVRGLRDPAWSAEMMRGIPRWFRGQFVVPTMTGPGVVSRTLAENPALAAGVSVLFPRDVCDETGWQKFGEFGVHMMRASWRKRDGFIRGRLSRFWENRRRKHLLKKSSAFGPTRSGAWRSILPLAGP